MPADASRSGADRQPGRRRRHRSVPRATAAAVSLLLAAAGAAGCGPWAVGGPEPAARTARGAPHPAAEPAPGGEDPAAREGTFRGLYVSGPSIRAFTACGTTAAVWLTDRTGGRLDEVYRTLAERPYRPIFVEFRGYPLPTPPDGLGTEYEGQVLALALRHAAAADGHDGGGGCYDDLGGAALRAFGGESRWRLDIAESGIALTEADSVRDIVFPYAPPHDDGPLPGRRRVYASQDPDEPGRRIEVAIEQRPCIDPASGAYFSLAAEVRLDGGRILTGCARENWR